MATTRSKPAKKKGPSKKERAIHSPPESFTLGAWMTRRGTPDATLAEHLGVDRVTVYRWATGSRRPPGKKIRDQIADYLRINEAALWRDPEESNAGLISLDDAAKHIRNNAVREALATIIKGYPAS